MFTKLLLKLSPITKYLTIAALVGAFLLGGYLSRIYYIGQIAEQDRQFMAQTNRYLERIIEKDNEYNKKIFNLNQQLIIINNRLKDEINKPEYQCPIPVDGIKLLNDAIKGTAAN
jgi:hypothetical protein